MMAEAPSKTEERTEEKKEAPKEEAAPAVLYSEALPFLTRRASLGPVGAYVGDYVSFNSKSNGLFSTF